MTTFNYTGNLPENERFTGIDKRGVPGWIRDTSGQIECPKCQARGCFNYSKFNMVDGSTRYNRMTCGICNGGGWIGKDMKVCDHSWEFVSNLGNCYNRFQCSKCEKFANVDSGD